MFNLRNKIFYCKLGNFCENFILANNAKGIFVTLEIRVMDMI